MRHLSLTLSMTTFLSNIYSGWIWLSTDLAIALAIALATTLSVRTQSFKEREKRRDIFRRERRAVFTSLKDFGVSDFVSNFLAVERD